MLRADSHCTDCLSLLEAVQSNEAEDVLVDYVTFSKQSPKATYSDSGQGLLKPIPADFGRLHTELVASWSQETDNHSHSHCHSVGSEATLPLLKSGECSTTPSVRECEPSFVAFHNSGVVFLVLQVCRGHHYPKATQQSFAQQNKQFLLSV